MRIRQQAARLISIAGAPCAAMLLAVLLFMVLLVANGKHPVATLWAILQGAFGSSLGLQETLTRATPLLFCALAAAIPARAGLFNVGGEGQLHCGAIAATAVALYAPWLPAPLVIPVMIAAAVLTGAVWGFWPGLLRARLGINEVLVTLMLNYVAILLVEHLVHGPWKDPSALGWPYTAQFPKQAVLWRWGDSNMHVGLLIALACSTGAFFLVRSSTWGFSIRVIEASPTTARYCKIPLRTYFVVLMALGGAFAAMAGLGEVSVIQGRLRSGISPGYGYAGFLVAWLARHDFRLIVPVAILVGGLYSGADALQLTAGLPSATTDVFMGLVYVAFLLSGFFSERIHAATWINRQEQAT